MMAQNPVKHSIKEIGNEPVDHVEDDYNFYRIEDGFAKCMVGDESGYAEVDEDDAEILNNYNRRAFLCYQWGVWTTAWARYELEEGLKLAHADGAAFVYADTDSVKYIGNIDWRTYNDRKRRLSTKNGAFADDVHGTRHYMGVYEFEGSYKQFRTLGAKKYAYVTEDDKLHITIAGVGKSKGAAELAEKGGIDALREGFVFDAKHGAAGIEATYNDHPDITEYQTPDGITIPITSNIYMSPSTYIVGLSGDYARLLNGIQLFVTDDV
jgi:hypothetical protein